MVMQGLSNSAQSGVSLGQEINSLTSESLEVVKLRVGQLAYIVVSAAVANPTDADYYAGVLEEDAKYDEAHYALYSPYIEMLRSVSSASTRAEQEAALSQAFARNLLSRPAYLLFLHALRDIAERRFTTTERLSDEDLSLVDKARAKIAELRQTAEPSSM